MSEELVPDLYRLAFIPGVFKCPKCEFELTKQAINFNAGTIGTTEKERISEECPNDGTMMQHVTYRDRLLAFDRELTRRIAGPRDLGVFLLDLLKGLDTAIEPRLGHHHCVQHMGYGNPDTGFEARLALVLHLEAGMYPFWLSPHDFSKTIEALVEEFQIAIKDLSNAQKLDY